MQHLGPPGACLADLLGLKSGHPAIRHAVRFRICTA